MTGKVLGVAGWSGSGKTTLICALILLFIARGLTVSTFKHTHHDIDPDPPGKDSRRHREAGAREGHAGGTAARRDRGEMAGNAPSAGALLAALRPVDLVLIEGFRDENHPKIEVSGAPRWASPAFVLDAAILSAVATVREDKAMVEQTTAVPVFEMGDPAGVAAFLVERLGIA